MSRVSRNPFTLQWQGTLSDYVRAIAWSPNSRILAASSAAGEVALWESDQLSLLQQGDNQSVDCLSFSHDGQFLAVGGQNGSVKIWHLQPEKIQLVSTLENAPAWVDQIGWSPVEHLLAFGVGRQVQLWYAETGEVSKTLDFEASSVLGIAWHPQGKFLAVCGHGGVKVWNREDWDADPYLLEVPGASIGAAWSADGKYLASGNLDRTISLLEWNNPPPWLMQGFPGKVSKIAWSDSLTKNGSPLLASACMEGIAIWEREPLTGENWQNYVLEKHEGFIQAIAFQPGSFLLASAADDGRVYLWHQAKQVSQTLKGANRGFSCLAWNFHGQQLAAGGQSGELLIWAN
ncbi:MAG: WD40 repeat domain-containing protein [Xenococcaceae cyanobacterium]